MDKKRVLYIKLDNLIHGLCGKGRVGEAFKILHLKQTLFSAENKPALRAWAVKARKVIGEIHA